VVVAGLAGDTGKSLVSLGVSRALADRGQRVAPFKKGPDFIDAAWLARAAGTPCRNLDTFMMSAEAATASVARAAERADIAIIEGNRGLFDGMDASGSHSTAALARLLGSPVVLVIDATKVTRTVASFVLGCRVMDPELHLAGVLLNRVATARQEAVIREAVAAVSDVPVLGAIPKLRVQHLPSRHLGLVTADEHPESEAAMAAVAAAITEHVDLDALLSSAADAAPLAPSPPDAAPAVQRSGPAPRVGVIRDRAFSFYYPENLEALEAAGAELVAFSALDDEELPNVDAIYAGGGFPEEHARDLSTNEPMLRSIGRAINEGLPVWAECGGLMYLARSVNHGGTNYPMVGALPVAVEQTPRPQGHGYVRARVDRDNPFLTTDTEVAGHEFHYSRLLDPEQVDTVMALDRGIGVGGGRDGIRRGSVVASYTHVHAAGLPQWAPGLVAAATGEAL
jgi:cobyrinic acid a,c-diamide synthase